MPDHNTQPHPTFPDAFLSLGMTKLVDGSSRKKLEKALESIYTGRGFRPPTPSIADGHIDRHEATNTYDSYREFVNRYEIDTKAMDDELKAISDYFTSTNNSSSTASVPALLYYPIVGPINRGPLPSWNQYLGRIIAVDETTSKDVDRDGPAITFTELHACRLGTPIETIVAADAPDQLTLPARTFKRIWIPDREN